jgi:phenol 2-monooxygenase
MQFHGDGFRAGDPRVQPAHPAVAARPADVPDEIDVLIVGADRPGWCSQPSWPRFRRS